MKLLSITKYLCTAAAVACLAFSSSTVFAHGDEDAGANAEIKLSAQDKRVVSMLNDYATAVQSGDIETVEKYVVTDDGFTSIDGTFLELGWKGYRKHIADEWPMYSDTRYQLSNIRPFVKGKLAYASMDFTMKVTVTSDKLEGGKRTFEMKGKATMGLIRSGNEWKIRHIHTVREAAKAPGR